MSFILDALKKSESDRQRQSGPSLFEVKVAPPRRKLPIWAVAIAALLAINIVVVSWMLLRHPAERQAAPVASTEAPPAAAPAAPFPAAASRAVAQDTAPARATVQPAGSGPGAAGSAGSEPMASAAPAASSAAAPPPAAAAVSPASPRAASPSQSPAAAPPADTADQSSGQGANGGDPSDYAPAIEPAAGHGSGASEGAAGELPLYQQVVGSANLPELHLDLHVFADRPQDRFAMINMHRVGEGDTLPGGVQVEAIRPDGVVLSYHGTRFLLPRN